MIKIMLMGYDSPRNEAPKQSAEPSLLYVSKASWHILNY